MTKRVDSSSIYRGSLASILFLLTVFALSTPFTSQAAPIRVPMDFCSETGCQGTINFKSIQAAVTYYCKTFAEHRVSNPNTPCPCGDPRVPCSILNQCKIEAYGGGNAQTRISGVETFFSNYNADGSWLTVNFLGNCFCPSGATKTSDATCICSGTNVWDGISACVPTCSAGKFLGVCTASAAALPKTQGRCEKCEATTPLPIQHGTGQKFKEQEIVRTPTLALVLSYNSTPISTLPYTEYVFGKGWSFNYGMRVWLTESDNAGVLRPDGKMLQFLAPPSGNVYVAEADTPHKLEKIVSGATIIGWKFTTAPGETVENYDAGGSLTSIVERNGRTTTFTYSTLSTLPAVASKAGLLIQVTDHFGRNLNLYYDFQARVVKAVDPAGNEYKFTYDGASSVVVSGPPSENLTSVLFPDLHTRTYHYNEQGYTASTNLANALTGITDENSARHAIYQYDATARAISSELAGGVGKYSVAYNVGGTSTVTDPLSATQTYTYQTTLGVPNVTAIAGSVCPSCGPAAISYDANGFAASRTDWNGNVTTYARTDSLGRLDLETSRTEAFGTAKARTITSAWNATFRLPDLITEPNRTTAFTYDANGNMLTKTVTDTASSAVRVWTYTYSGIGQVLTVNGPRTDVTDLTTYTYYADNDADFGKRGNINTISNALSQVNTINTYDANGRPLTITDPNGLVTTLTYAPRGWLTSRNVGGETTIYDYDFAGQLTKVTLPDSSYIQYTYDAAHRLTQINDNLGNKIIYTLDNMGNRTQEDVRDPSNVLARTRTRVYSALNRLSQDIGGTTPLTQITQYTYDNQGNLKTITDPLTHVTTNNYDALNRLEQVIAPGTTTTTYGFNALDQLVSVTDPRSNATTYTIDALDNLKTQVSPDTGTTVDTYDAAGNLLTSTDAKSQITTYTYDALNRVTRITYHDTSKVDYTYDQGTYGKGHLTQITETNAAAVVTHQIQDVYDIHGRLASETRTMSGVNYVTQYGYDASGRMNTITYPSGRLVTYSFDSAGRISGVTTTPAGGSLQTVVSGVTYHPFGGVSGFTYGNGQTYSRTIDLDGRIAGFTLGGVAQTVTFDAASRITGQSYFPNPAQALTYGYDVLDRLTSVVTPTTTSGFGYDANGNRTAKTVGAVNSTYAYPSTNNKLSSITSGTTKTYVHDADGSITSDATNTFTYDTRGRLIQAATALGTVTYGLNSLGQRYAKTLSGTTTIFHYDKQGKLIGESTPLGTASAEYMYLGDIPVAVFK